MAPESTPTPTTRSAADRAGLSVLGAGHFVVDMAVGMLSPLLPVFKRTLGLSDVRTSLILAAVTFSSSFIQPVFGVVADRVRATWFLWGGVALAATGLALSGLVTSFALLLTLIVICGLGVGAYHPEAARVANHLAGERTTSGVAWFTVGGNIGFAMGPLVVALAVPWLDEKTTLLILVPAAVAVCLLAAQHSRIAHPIVVTSGERIGASHIPGMMLLVTATSVRTWVQLGLLTIVPLYLTEERGFSTRDQGLVIFLFVMTGSVGTIVGSLVADRIGGKQMLAGSLPVATPFIAGFIVWDGAAGIMSLAAAGFVVMASFSATVVMGQDYMPHRLALAAAWVLGFGAIGSATPWLPIVGAIADSAGRETALWTLAALPLLGAAIAAFLPHPRTVARGA